MVKYVSILGSTGSIGRQSLDIISRLPEVKLDDTLNDKAQHGGQDVLSGQLTQMDGKNQVSRSEEHAKQRAGDQQALAESQTFFHGESPFL